MKSDHGLKYRAQCVILYTFQKYYWRLLYRYYISTYYIPLGRYFFLSLFNVYYRPPTVSIKERNSTMSAIVTLSSYPPLSLLLSSGSSKHRIDFTLVYATLYIPLFSHYSLIRRPLITYRNHFKATVTFQKASSYSILLSSRIS